MSERTMEALRDRINARLQTSAISRDRASAAGREVVAQCRQSDVETLEWVLSEIDAALATPEPGGEGEVWLQCEATMSIPSGKLHCVHRDGAGHDGKHEFRAADDELLPTPAASEDVRESVEMAHFWVLHGEMTRSQRRAVADLLDQLALLRTPRGEWVPPPMQWAQATGRDGARYTAGWNACRDAMLAALRSESPDTPRGEGEAALVEAVLRRWNRLAADVEGSEGPLTETELVGIARDVAAALRSEAQGEVR